MQYKTTATCKYICFLNVRTVVLWLLCSKWTIKVNKNFPCNTGLHAALNGLHYLRITLVPAILLAIQKKRPSIN